LQFANDHYVTRLEKKQPTESAGQHRGTDRKNVAGHLEILEAFLDPETGPQALPTLFILSLFLLLLKSLKLFFIPIPIVITIHIQVGDNILHNRTVSDFQVKS